WTWAYLVIAFAAFLPFPILVGTARDEGHEGSRWTALGTGLIASVVILLASLALTAAVGWAVLNVAAQAGMTSRTNVTPAVLALALLPFVGLALALPRIRRMRGD